VRQDSGFQQANYSLLSWILTVFAAGVFISGLRDLSASRNLLRGS
jgi:hypothetical protein